MDERAGGRRSADSPPPLPDDLLLEILLRLPPEPIHLQRASFVSKHWRGLVHDAGFLRLFREFHGGPPPLLGFFNNQPGLPLFVPTAGAYAASTAAKMPHEEWWALDCRHGRALLEKRHSPALLVWDLVTGDKRYVPLPRTYWEDWDWEYNAAVLCAAGHADSSDCHSCPFLVAFVFSHPIRLVTSACVYSSETQVWVEITSIDVPNELVAKKPTALVGNSLYWLAAE